MMTMFMYIVYFRDGSPEVQIQVINHCCFTTNHITAFQTTRLKVYGEMSNAWYKLVGAIRFIEYVGGVNHYTAFIHSIHNSTQWFYMDDSRVSNYKHFVTEIYNEIHQ